MPSNLFGKLKPNQLMAMMQQQPPQDPGAAFGQMMGGAGGGLPPKQQPQGQQSPLFDFSHITGGKAAPLPPVKDPYTGHVLPPTNFTASKGQQRQGASALKDVVGLMPDVAGGLGAALGTSGASRLEGDAPSPEMDDARKIMFGATQGPMMEIPEGYGEPKPSALDAYMSDQFSASPAAVGPSLSGGFDLTKLGQEAQSRMGKQNDFRQQFEGTPELDQLIAKAQGDLATAKSERKKPGLGEFLTLALMNLGNRDHRNNADMVLGTREQDAKEGRLESLLTQLEGGRANAKMGGRRQYQANQQRDRYNALEQMLQTQEIARKQQNEDRDFQFKNQKMGADKLMQRVGQITNQLGTETDPNKRDALRRELERLDPYSQRRQQPQAPQDNRQSRMFGELLGGGGYA